MTHALYPGSFDPVTNGHLDIIQKALKVFDKVTVCVAVNPKKQALFKNPQMRIEMIEQCLPEAIARKHLQVISWYGMVVDACVSVGASVIVRGFRALADFESEFQMAHINKRLAPAFETVMFPTSEETTFYSSSIAKELAQLNAPLVGVVPLHVEKALRAHFSQ